MQLRSLVLSSSTNSNERHADAADAEESEGGGFGDGRSDGRKRLPVVGWVREVIWIAKLQRRDCFSRVVDQSKEGCRCRE